MKHSVGDDVSSSRKMSRNVSYTPLVDELAGIGAVDSEPNVGNKLSRGKLTAVFILQCLELIGASSLRLQD